MFAPAETTTDTLAGVTVGARNAELADLAAILKDQRSRAVDVVAPSTSLGLDDDGRLTIAGAEPVIDDTGVDDPNGAYRLTDVGEDTLAARLNVPAGYLRRMIADRPDIAGAIVNGTLHGGWAGTPLPLGDDDAGYPADDRRHLVRLLRGDDDVGVARAILSDRYRIVDNLDVLLAALDGIRATGRTVDIDGADLTTRNMTVRVRCPEVAAVAEQFLDGYRSPFTGEQSDGTVFAGFVIRNSETGSGALSIAPRVIVQVCSNGMTVGRDAFRRVHLGARLDEGVVKWSDATKRKVVELARSQAADAVESFLDPDYLADVVARFDDAAGDPITDRDTARQVLADSAFTHAETDDILAHFAAGGQATRGGLASAVSSYARALPDADAAYDAEETATRILAAA